MGGVWRIRGCLEDKWIGGRLSLVQDRRDSSNNNGRRGRGVTNSAKRASTRIEYAKSWFFPTGTDGSLAARFDLRAAYDVNTQRGTARFGFGPSTRQRAVVETGAASSPSLVLVTAVVAEGEEERPLDPCASHRKYLLTGRMGALNSRCGRVWNFPSRRPCWK